MYFEFEKIDLITKKSVQDGYSKLSMCAKTRNIRMPVDDKSYKQHLTNVHNLYKCDVQEYNKLIDDLIKYMRYLVKTYTTKGMLQDSHLSKIGILHDNILEFKRMKFGYIRLLPEIVLNMQMDEMTVISITNEDCRNFVFSNGRIIRINK
jgi:queuine/archaeosine tRNA-ribosyltransferase